ncbi:hypothetical protein B9479_000507 [Cryptococcus floricola]|uniref:Uncharacterized protein n=1 Tax=Cryptococcus floricola TaxID=2591691 RepID=A0A5D3B7U4_9TREE|nr:hypothetical protein B9479_000507 [Cryptococcus floricola]
MSAYDDGQLVRDASSTTAKVPLLLGNANYVQWSSCVSSLLLKKQALLCLKSEPIEDPSLYFDGMDVSDPSTIPTPLTPLEQTRLAKQNEGLGILLQSLSEAVKNAVSAEAQDVFRPNPKMLWDELYTLYSQTTGHRISQLYATLWSTRIPLGADPLPYLGAQRATMAQLRLSQNVEDQQVAYAMLHALSDDEYRPIKHSGTTAAYQPREDYLRDLLTQLVAGQRAVSDRLDRVEASPREDTSPREYTSPPIASHYRPDKLSCPTLSTHSTDPFTIQRHLTALRLHLDDDSVNDRSYAYGKVPGCFISGTMRDAVFW